MKSGRLGQSAFWLSCPEVFDRFREDAINVIYSAQEEAMRRRTDAPERLNAVENALKTRPPGGFACLKCASGSQGRARCARSSSCMASWGRHRALDPLGASQERAGKKSGLGQELEPVADSQGGRSGFGLVLDFAHDGGARRHAPGTQIVAVGEASGQNDGVQLVRERGFAVVDANRASAERLNGDGRVAVAVGSGKGDAGDAPADSGSAVNFDVVFLDKFVNEEGFAHFFDGIACLLGIRLIKGDGDAFALSKVCNPEAEPFERIGGCPALRVEDFGLGHDGYGCLHVNERVAVP